MARHSCCTGLHARPNRCTGQHRLPPGKREIFQHDIRVPFLVRGPGVAPGSVFTQLVGNYDLARTWADIGGATPNAGAPVVDGRSLLDLLVSNGTAAWGRTFTLQEGYQTCEDGTGEGGACSHKDAAGPTMTHVTHMTQGLASLAAKGALP